VPKPHFDRYFDRIWLQTQKKLISAKFVVLVSGAIVNPKSAKKRVVQWCLKKDGLGVWAVSLDERFFGYNAKPIGVFHAFCMAEASAFHYKVNRIRPTWRTLLELIFARDESGNFCQSV
jgi:hypothetical protein